MNTILIVDDDQRGQDVLESMLLDQNYKLVFASSGREALVKASEVMPDLILLDVMMPGIDGFEVCKHLRLDKQLAEVPIILVTALEDRESRLRGIEVGADDFVSKPFDRTELKARVKSIIRLNRYRKLVESEEKLKEQAALLDVTHDSILVVDVTGKLLYYNKNAEQLYGWTESEAAKNVEIFLGEGYLSKLIELCDGAIKYSWEGELEQKTKEHKQITVNSRWTIMPDKTGYPKSVLVVNSDITEKKKLEAQLLRTQRLENIGALASGIAHDLNNVLTPIMIAISIMQRKYKDESSQRMLSTLENTTKRGADLIKQVLSFGRGLKNEKNIIQIKHLILEIEKIIKETFPKSIQIFINISKDLWTISADTTQMHQILLNLSVNARDAMMPRGGTITISAENILIDDSYASIYPEAKAGQYILITTKDIGCGIAEDILDKIFEPFFSTKQIGEGTGLGLATVKNIIKSHNGFLSLKSKVGEGTEFKVYLPASKENLAEPPDELFMDDELSGNAKQVLVVEDEASIREITKTSLDAYNYKVLTANDGIEAIALYAQYKNDIDVILLDIAMPIMDGATALPALYRLNPKVKIIVVTGFGATYTLEALSDYGVRVILKKPYTTKQLLVTLKDIISGL